MSPSSSLVPAPGLLEKFLSDESSENTRIRKSVIDAFVKKGWKVSNTEPFAGSQVIDGIKINGQGILEAR